MTLKVACITFKMYTEGTHSPSISICQPYTVLSLSLLRNCKLKTQSASCNLKTVYEYFSYSTVHKKAVTGPDRVFEVDLVPNQHFTNKY